MDAAQDIKSKLSIEDVIGEYVRLKRAGRSYKGLSPFTSEKTPSFVVSPEKQIWHDFSSNKGGDMISFVMEAETVDFKTALELLARKAGIDLAQYSSQTKGPNKETLYKILADATHFYQKSLLNEPRALDYLKNRNFTKQTIIEFQLGYSPNSQDSLRQYLTAQGHDFADIKKVGLVSEYNGRTRDMFRGRVMIPLHDGFGRVIGFTARLLDDAANGPKYINTPSTILYDKSRHVYGLHLSKQAIKEADAVVIVEGNMDVVSSHQAGVRNVVAIAGTALTKYQAKNLAGFSENIRLCFDEDRAGLQATERSLDILSDMSVNLCVVTIPSGKDPDELINKDPALWRKAISEYDYALDWLLQKYLNDNDIVTATGKRHFGEQFGRVLQKISDPIEKEHYVALASEKTGISTQALLHKTVQEPARAQQTAMRQVKATKTTMTEDIVLRRYSTQFLAILFGMPASRRFAADISQDFLPDPAQKALLKLFQDEPTVDVLDKSHQVLGEIEEYVKIIVVTFEELFQKVESLELEYEAEKLKNNIIETHVRIRKKQISNELNHTNSEDNKGLLEESSRLDKILTNKKA